MKKGTKFGPYTYHGFTVGRWQGSETVVQEISRSSLIAQGFHSTQMLSVMTVPEGYEIDFKVQDSVVLKKKDSDE